MHQPTITPTDDGPYLVQGHVSLIDTDGNAYTVDEPIALCRCGLSTTNPFCDGSHEKTYFHAVNRADKVLSRR